jgi:muramidase (phage lysozyme)
MADTKSAIDPKLKAFLDLIAFSEGTSTHLLTTNDGYDVLVSGIHGPSVFTDYADHPFASGGSVTVRESPLLISTAAGRYQLLARYWHVYRVQLDLPDYGPASQDAVALQQIKERGAQAHIESGDIEGAIKACSSIWASLPGNDYGQGGKSMVELVAKYQELAVNA